MSEKNKRFKTVAELQCHLDSIIDSIPEPVGMTPLEMERRIADLERELAAAKSDLEFTSRAFEETSQRLAAMTAKRDALEEAARKVVPSEYIYDSGQTHQLRDAISTHGKATDGKGES